MKFVSAEESMTFCVHTIIFILFIAVVDLCKTHCFYGYIFAGMHLPTLYSGIVGLHCRLVAAADLCCCYCVSVFVCVVTCVFSAVMFLLIENKDRQ